MNVLRTLIGRLKSLFGKAAPGPVLSPIEAARLEKKRAKAQRAKDLKAVTKLKALLAATNGKFVVADVETTGLSVERNEIIEIAAVLTDAEGVIYAQLSTLVINTRSSINSFISDLTGITQADVRKRGIKANDAIAQFAQLAQGYPVFCHNAAFDKRFLAEAHRVAERSFDNEVLCTLAIARALWPNLKSHKLIELARMLGLPAPTHRSLDDVMATVGLICAARQESIAIFSGAKPVFQENLDLFSKTETATQAA